MICNCWRKFTKDIPKGKGMPDTKEALEATLDMRDELIYEQKEEISKLKQKNNKLKQALNKAKS